MRDSLDNAAALRLRIVEAYCPAAKRTGMHNNIETRHWFRLYDVCASCGYVQRVKRLR